MTWTYHIRTGELINPKGLMIGHGYSGKGESLDNPDDIHKVSLGPIPPGIYKINPPRHPADNHGVLAMPLTPDKKNQMYSRSGFMIHGDNPEMNHSASNGCIILNRPIRQMIADSLDHELQVEI